MNSLINLPALFHESDSRFCYALDEHTALVTLLTAKGDPNLRRASIIYQGKYRGIKDQKKVDLSLAYSDSLHDYYQTTLYLPDVRIIYVFELEDSQGNIVYFSEAGVSETYEMGETCYNVFQLPYINPSDVIYPNRKFADRVFYQIFPDRFCRDESLPHSKTLIKWGDPVGIGSFAGGNLKGIKSKIGYLKELGIGGIYLNPVWKGSTNHKYDTIEYGSVDPDFGTDEDLRELSDECHRNGILLILDMVYNHMSCQNPIFRNVVEKGRESPYYDWFLIHGEKPSFEKGNYESFGTHPYMPKNNLNDKGSADYFIRKSMEIYEKYHPDGYRLDVGDECAHTFWRKLRFAMRELDPDFLLLGEDWHNGESFLNYGDQFDSIMNYGFTRLAEEFFVDKRYDAQTMADNLNGLWARYKEPVNHNLLNLIDSHDKKRLMDECGFNRDVYLSAHLLMFLYPGLPSLYYGDEAGLPGRDNIDCRRCFPWGEEGQDKLIYKYIKEMIAIRNSYPLVDAKREFRERDGLLEVSYQSEKGSLLILWNATNERITIKEKGPDLSLNYDGDAILPNGFFIKKS